METISFQTRSEFRQWLQKNALKDDGVWILFRKKGALTYAEALEEALCFGWIDGQLKNIDETSHARYFKQRNVQSSWSEKNKTLVEQLESSGLMTDYGRSKIETAKKNGHWESKKLQPLTKEQLEQFAEMIKPFENAYNNYMKMNPSTRKVYASSYFIGTKTAKGKEIRFAAIIKRLELNLNPMQKLPE